MKQINHKAFTLIEILLVSALLGAVSIAVANAFSNGLKLWARADVLTRQTQAGIFLDKFSEDLRQSCTIKTIGFKGISTQLQFPTLIFTQADPRSTRANEEMIETIGSVRYRFDPQKKTIFRSQSNYGQTLKEIYTEEQEIAVGVEDLVFKYHSLTEKGLEVRSLIDQGIPAAVSVELTIQQEGGSAQLKRFCPIPVGGAL